MRTNRRLTYVALLIALSGAAFAAPTVIVAGDGERFAAEELQEHVKLATGRVLPIVARESWSEKLELEKGRKAFFLSRKAARDPFDEEAVVEGKDGNVRIEGFGRRGTEYGVYAYLERMLGVRWYTAEDPAFVPKRAALPDGDFRFVERPALKIRQILSLPSRYKWREPGLRRQSWLFAFRNRLNVMNDKAPDMPTDLKGKLVSVFVQPPVSSDHNLLLMLDPKKYFKDHPDWYSMNAAGQRVSDRHVCFSNPDACAELERLYGEQIRTCRAEAGPDRAVRIAIQPEDVSDELCHCERCQACKRTYGAPAAAFFKFVIAFAEKLQKTDPNTYLYFNAYRPDQTLVPPTGLRFPDNVFVGWAPLFGDMSKDWSDGSATNRAIFACQRTWCELAHVVDRDYTTIYGAGFTPYLQIGRWVEALRQPVVGGSFEHSTGVSEGVNFGTMQTWMLLRLYRDPQADTDALQREYCAWCYGPAAAEAEEYMREITAAVRAYPVPIGYHETTALILTHENLMRWQALFERGVAKLNSLNLSNLSNPSNLSDLYIQRLNELRAGLDLATLTQIRKLREAHPEFPQTAETISARAETTMKAALERHVCGGVFYKKHLANAQLMAFREVKPLPDFLAELPEKRILQIFPANSRHVQGMADGALGLAVGGSASNPRWAKSFTGAPPIFGVLDNEKMKFMGKNGSRTTIPKESIVPDVFTTYPIGRVTIASPRCELWNNCLWILNLSLADAWAPGLALEYDAYVSIKFEGPVYSPKSTNTVNGIWVDRIILVRPE